MNILLLGGGSVVHTQRWANGLVEAGARVVCVSQHPYIEGGWHADVVRERLPHAGPAGYFLNAPAVGRLFRTHACDLLNAHYATGYGVLASLSGVRPRLVSVWGSDVYDFPQRSLLHRALVRGVLGRADGVASTSIVMAEQVRRLMPAGWSRPIALTPFGVDTTRFDVRAQASPATGDGQPLVIGTVKTLAPKYGIDVLVRAYALLAADRELQAALPSGLRLRLVGAGEQRAELEALVRQLGLEDQVEFVGPVPHAQVPAWLQGMDIYVAASRLDSESFGVAVIEASACGLPVVVSRVGGLPEVVREGETGLVVEREDPVALAQALRRLSLDPEMRARLGRHGREHVRLHYEWRVCVQRMLDTYRGLLGGRA